MLAALLITTLPTVLMFLLFPKIGFKIKSIYLRIAFSCFAGLYLFTFLTFFLAIAYTTFTSHVLFKATFSVLILIECSFFFLFEEIQQLLKSLQRNFVPFLFRRTNFFLIVFCAFFSIALLASHLKLDNGMIYRSPIYWDFHWHVAIIQNFVFGDNFPPQNESFSGVPMVYHFFGDLVISMYEATGLSLTTAITFSSILFLFFALIGLIGIAEEFFQKTWMGFLAVCLALTSSSGHFLYFFAQRTHEFIPQIFLDILTNTDSPWYTSFIPTSPYHYSGIMFNLFFFIEERHMLLAPLFLLFCLWIIVNRERFSFRMLFLLGVLMGAFFYWNVFIVLMLASALLFVLLFDTNRKKTLMLFVGCFLLIGIQYDALKHSILSSGAFFPDTTTYPQWNTAIATHNPKAPPGQFLSWLFKYYGFAYGLKALLAPIGLFLIWKKYKRIGITLVALIVPTFFIINTVQISPSGVGENHKMLLNMTIMLDIATAYVLYSIFMKKGVYMYFGLVILFLLTISGIIEHVPFINSRPTVLYADYAPSSLARTIQQQTPPQATIVGNDETAIQLAGRKIFVGESAGASASLNKKAREATESKIYKAKTISELCSAIGNNPIDYVEFPKTSSFFTASLQGTVPHFFTRDAKKDLKVFINTQKLCKKDASDMLQ